MQRKLGNYIQILINLFQIELNDLILNLIRFIGR